MGFLRTHTAVESWLRLATSAFEPLSQQEYLALVGQWRSRFEERLVVGNYLVGSSAQWVVENELPCDAFIFSVPGYKWLPASTDARFDPAYAYRVSALREIDFRTANEADATIVDQGLTFSCLCTHEAGALARLQFCAL